MATHIPRSDLRACLLLFLVLWFVVSRAVLANENSTVNTQCAQPLLSDHRQYAQQLSDPAFHEARFLEMENALIRAIQFVRFDVFDNDIPEENNPLYRLVNFLNIRTREKTLRHHLLFAEGERLDSALITETERNLRSLPYLANAFVMPLPACNGGVNLVIVVKDAWTTQPILSFSRDGGEDESDVGFVEGNFLGVGAEVSIIHTRDEQRATTSYRVAQQYLFGKPLSLSFGVSDSDDGFARSFTFAKPYYQLSTKTAFAVDWDDSQSRLNFNQGTRELAAYDVEVEAASVSFSWLQQDNPQGVLRLTTGISRYREIYSDFKGLPDAEALRLLPIQPDERLYPSLGFSWLSKHFKTLSNINHIGRLEDINLGLSLNAGVGYSPSSIDSVSSWSLTSSGRYRLALRNTLLTVSGQYRTTTFDRESAHANHYNAQLELQNLWLLGARHRIFSRVYGRQVKALGLHQAITLGGAENARGYPANFVFGHRAVGGALEYRYHAPWHIFNILRVGFAAYWDAAKLWNDRFLGVNNGYQREWLHSVGVGLRLLSSKTQVGNVVHIDLATPTGYDQNVDGHQFLIRAERRF